MKSPITQFRVVLSIQIALASLVNAELGPKWRANCVDLATEIQANPTKNGILELGGKLVGVDHYNSGSAEEARVIREVTSALVSIPGHAKYFADEIKREQQEVAVYPTLTGPRVSYDRQRAWHFETLSHLSSPETVAVLGDFLGDDIDTPHPLVSPDSDWGENPRANSFVASSTLGALGLRNAPNARGTYSADPVAHLAKSRAWWEEIKSGKRAFSFVGQMREYRFKPDGTWDTIPIANPPDDAPGRQQAGAADRPMKRPPPVAQQLAPMSNVWNWIIGITAALLAGVVWLGHRNKPK